MRIFLLKCYNIIIHQSIAHTMGRLHVVAWIGVTLYPAYFFVWEYVIPLPYESLFLRLSCALICFPLFFETWFRRRPALLGLYWLCSMAYCLPFFFVYMMLMNHFHYFWALSAHSAIVILFLFFPNFRASLLVISLGVAGAILTYLLQFGDMPPIEPYPEKPALSQLEFYFGLLSVFVFVAAATNLLNFHRKSIERSSSAAIQKWAATILHQTLTPLNEMQIAVEGIGLHLDDRPKLKKLADSVIEKGQAATRMARRLMVFAMPLDRSLRFEEIGAREAIASAITSYPFGVVGPSETAELISFEEGPDFLIRTPSEPFSQAIHNLINNAMHAIHDSRRGNITIRTVAGSRRNVIMFRDTASGIPIEQLPYLFDGFFTRRQGGLGQGLTYCQQFMTHVGGKIECVSQTGANAFTEFRLEFPVA